MLTQEQFYLKMLPYAQQACRTLAVPEDTMVPVLLAQWDAETGREMESWVGHNNYAGITNGSPAAGFRRYATIADFVADYCDVLLTTWGGQAYGKVVAAARVGESPDTVAQLLADSPWDAGHYTIPGKEQGSLLRQRMPFYVEVVAKALMPPAWQVAGRNFVVKHGISDGTRPDQPATRAEVWEMLRRAAASE